MCSWGQEVTHQHPWSPGEGRAEHWEEKNMKLEFWSEEKRAKMMQINLPVLVRGGGGTPNQALPPSTAELQIRSPSRSISITWIVPKFSFTPTNSEDPPRSSARRGETGEPRAREKENPILGNLGTSMGLTGASRWGSLGGFCAVGGL